MVQAVYSVAAQTAPVASAQPQHTDNSQVCNQQQQGITEVLSLRLAPRRKAKAVRWSDDTVDNEFMNKKKSKKCCIFHKQKSFGDWSDNDSDDDCEDCATSDGKQGS